MQELDDIADVHAAAARCRSAIESRTNLRSVGLASFPVGSCGDASLLLGTYLKDSGLGEWTYHSGSRGQQTHGWIERDGVIVDITADQFPDVDTEVVVTRGREWHSQFEHTSGSSGPATLKAWDGPAMPDLESDYLLIRELADSLH